MSYTHRVQFTKNILEGDRQGEQIRASFEVSSAWAACRRALHLSQAGVQRDPLSGDLFTAHNVDIVPIERELADLVDAGEWGRHEAADVAYDMRGDH